MLESFTVETFAGRIGEHFSVAVEFGRIDLELITAAALTPPSNRAVQSSDDRVPFSIEFTGPGEAVLPQGTYRFEHPALGIFEIFVVPIGRGQTGVRYEAVFT